MRRHIDTLSGGGQLFQGEEFIGDVTYELEVYLRGYGQSRLFEGSISVLEGTRQLIRYEEFVLTLEDGRSLEITTQRQGPHPGDWVVSGEKGFL
jgi:hypothetical protein